MYVPIYRDDPSIALLLRYAERLLLLHCVVR